MSIYRFEHLPDNTHSNDWGFKVVPDIQEMIRQQASIMFQAEEDWFVEQVIAVLKTKGYTVTKEAANG